MFSTAIQVFGFVQSKANYLFRCQKGKTFTALLIYVDNILIKGNDLNAIFTIKKFLHSHFRIKDLVNLKYFLSNKCLGQGRVFPSHNEVHLGNSKGWWTFRC